VGGENFNFDILPLWRVFLTFEKSLDSTYKSYTTRHIQAKFCANQLTKTAEKRWQDKEKTSRIKNIMPLKFFGKNNFYKNSNIK
jgi:hypothetical protein